MNSLLFLAPIARMVMTSVVADCGFRSNGCMNYHYKVYVKGTGYNYAKNYGCPISYGEAMVKIMWRETRVRPNLKLIKGDK